MSTRCRIAIENEDHSVDSIYCHFDGYIIGVGKYLYENYKTDESVKKLISMGDRSSIDKDDSVYEDTKGQPMHFQDVKDLVSYFKTSDQEYLYLYGCGCWLVATPWDFTDQGLEFDLLEDVL